jgi:restriction system protein
MILAWWNSRLKETSAEYGPGRQKALAFSAPYNDDAPAIRNASEFHGAIEHLEYALFRRYENQLTKAERIRVENTIRNALFKVERFLERLDDDEKPVFEAVFAPIRRASIEQKERSERLRLQARQADLKLNQLANLTPDGFEEFVAELFEALGYEVERCGGTGDEGIDLRVRKHGLIAVVQCKYHKTGGVIGSPDLQKFLGTIHHAKGHKGFFVTTRTFSLAGEKFVANHPIELIDGPRLVELVREAMGPGANREAEPVWF